MVEHVLTDPEARARAARSAEELVHRAESLPSDAAADQLIAAAEVYGAQLGDLASAATLLRRAVHSEAHALRALCRLRSLAEARGDWQEAADVLDLLVRRCDDDEERLSFLAARADVLSHKLSRVAEARAAYREIARLSENEPLRAAAADAARKVDAILEKGVVGPSLTQQLAAPIAHLGLPIAQVEPLPVISEPVWAETEAPPLSPAELPAAALAASLRHAATVVDVRPPPSNSGLGGALAVSPGVQPVQPGVPAMASSSSVRLDAPSISSGGASLAGAKDVVVRSASKSSPEPVAASRSSLESTASETVKAPLAAFRRSSSVGEGDWSEAVEVGAHDTIVDQRLGVAELEAIQRARARVAERSASQPNLASAHALKPAARADARGAVDEARRRDEILDALRAGDLKRALRTLDAIAPDATEAVTPAILTRAAILAAELRDVAASERCLARSEAIRGQASMTPIERRAWMTLAAAHVHAGAPREAALAFMKVAPPTNEAHARPDAARGRLLTSIGEAFGASGDADEALHWLKDALAANPVPAATVIAKLLVADKHMGHLRSLSDRMDRFDLRGPDRARWLVVLAGALASLGDFQGAREALDTALSVDPSDLGPAEELVRIGRTAREREWVDEGLRELRVRALERGEQNRVFLAAALLVSRGVATPEERAAYEGLRMGLAPRPRVPIDPRGLAERVGPGPLRPAQPSSAPMPVPTGERPRAPVAEVVAELESMLLAGNSHGEGWGRAGDALGLALEKWPTCRRALAFEVARQLVAASDPALNRGGRPEAAAAERLDRAALVLVQDPVIALEAVGLGTERAEVLEAFAASTDLPRLWARYGLGLESRRSVAKAAQSV